MVDIKYQSEAERRLGSRPRGEQGLGDLGFDPTEAERRIPREANGAKMGHLSPMRLDTIISEKRNIARSSK